MTTADTMHVATVNEIINTLQSKFNITAAKSIFADSVFDQLTDILPQTFCDMYKSHRMQIDDILKRQYYNYVIPQVDKPTEISEDIIEQCGLLSIQLKEIALPFFMLNAQAISRLWEIESAVYNPVENYDRHEAGSNIRSGSEKINTKYIGTEKESTTPQGDRTITRTQNGAIKEQNAGEVATNTQNHDTSYSTNLVNTTDTTQTDGTSRTTTYDALTNVEKLEGGVSETKTKEFDGRLDENEHLYDNVKDATESYIHGNIGVVDAPTMLGRHVDFWATYKFWEHFWRMWINYAGSTTFDTLRSDYADEL